MVEVSDILAAERGHVIAPAGCGKTELIAKAVSVPCQKPTLVLTHTVAGVAALRQRLVRDKIPTSQYRLNTIAGWSMNLISMFPERAGYALNPLAPLDYERVQRAAANLCQSGLITRELRATYARVLVDEYQDCSMNQHLIIRGLNLALPAVVFGDPLQAIFNFGADPLPSWNGQVAVDFPMIGQLAHPWRWRNVGADDLGQWLMQVRAALVSNQSIDLRTCPGRVAWHPLTGDANQNLTQQIAAQYDLARRFPNDKILVIGDSRVVEMRHNFAIRAPGVAVVEPVEYRDVIAAANNMNNQTGPALLDACLVFLNSVMTNVSGDQLKTRVQSILGSRNRTPPTPPERAAIALATGGGYAQAVGFLQAMAADRDRRVYRLSAFNILLDAVSTAAANASTDLTSAIAQLREQQRHAGRAVPPRAIGSTLLLKGLETDHAIILDADSPRNPMSKEDLYVALTRGARSVTVFSRNPILP